MVDSTEALTPQDGLNDERDDVFNRVFANLPEGLYICVRERRHGKL